MLDSEFAEIFQDLHKLFRELLRNEPISRQFGARICLVKVVDESATAVIVAPPLPADEMQMFVQSAIDSQCIDGYIQIGSSWSRSFASPSDRQAYEQWLDESGADIAQDAHRRPSLTFVGATPSTELQVSFFVIPDSTGKIVAFEAMPVAAVRGQLHVHWPPGYSSLPMADLDNTPIASMFREAGGLISRRTEYPEFKATRPSKQDYN